MRRWRLTVPATSANLGPGFDCLGLALGLSNTLDIECDEDAGAWDYRADGEGCEQESIASGVFPRQIARQRAASLGRPLPALRVRARNAIPISRGLGSSSATIVAALMIADLATDTAIDIDALLPIASALEGHPDNVAAVLHGGLTVASGGEGDVAVVRLAPARPLQAVLFIPDRALSTARARAVLPAQLDFHAAARSVGHAALMVAGLTSGRYDVLRRACQDDLHQPYRAQLLPWLPEMIEMALGAGALAAWLSGSGSSVLALTENEHEEAGPIAAAMAAVAARAGETGRTLAMTAGGGGARITFGGSG